MKIQNRIKPVRLALVGILALVLVLSACSTGTSTADTSSSDQSASSAGNSTSTETTAPAGNSGSSSQAQPTEASASSSTVSFANDVLPIFESRCVQCHGGDRTEARMDLTTYAKLMAGGEDGAVIIPGNADNSFLAQLIIDQKMPKRGPKLTPAQTQIIVDWINEGALDN